ncbi:MAG: DUF4136 domain-containing protein [Bacteroidota bacterium]
MKTIKIILVPLLFILSSCNSISVYSDFDKSVDFNQYKTYAFNKNAIDKVQISALDKKRILQAIDSELSKKGMNKSETPDILVGFFTKEREQIDVSNYAGWGGYGWGLGWGYGYNPYWGRYSYANTSVEGTLFIDFVDTKKNDLIWQGQGVGYLTQNHSEKEVLINDFVAKILVQYPPVKNK